MKKLIISIGIMCLTMSSALAMTYNQALKQDKPIVIMFKMPYCSACKKATPLFDAMEKKYSDKFNFVKDDTTKSNLSSKFGVNSVPDVFIVEPKTEKATKVSYNCLFKKGCFEKQLINYGK